MYKKIYIHHYYTKILFYKLAHNSINKIFNISDNQIGTVECEYNGCKFEFIFDPILNDNEDGVHILDFFSILFQHEYDEKLKNIQFSESEDIQIIERIADLISSKKNWIITFFRTERLFGDYDIFQKTYQYIHLLQKQIDRLKNHKFITDNFFLNQTIQFKYPNFYYAFTNTIWQWNELINIRYYYEFKQVFERLNFDYDLMYSVRNHKYHRMEILRGLSLLNNKKILLQRTDSIFGGNFYEGYHDELKELETIPNINFNSIIGKKDFENLTIIQHASGIAFDLYFRLFSKAKVQVLDESWAWSKDDFQIQYLSEKTIGIILMNIPFISTHIYPIDFLTKQFDLPKHPFYNEIKEHSGDAEKFVKFVETFMSKFDENYLLIKEWTTMCHDRFINKLDTHNDLLYMLIDDFQEQDNLIKKNTKIF